MDSMKLGIIVRGEQRGLGIQSTEAFRHLNPTRTLAVDMGAAARGFHADFDQFPGATVVEFVNGEFPERAVREWLDGLDVVFTVETFYDWRMCDWARDVGCATVCQPNPEFFRHHTHPLASPTAWWAPTSWRLNHLPPGTRVVPVPVATDRLRPSGPPPDGEPLRALHVMGHQAMADRNGTRAVFDMLRHLRRETRVHIASQDRHIQTVRRAPRMVHLSITKGGVPDYWSLYEGADVLLLPRRYGGLSLPVQEAMAAGVVPVMTDVEPQASTWPIVPVRTRPRGQLLTPGGTLTLANADPIDLARVVDMFNGDRERLNHARTRVLDWAAAHSWEALLPLYETELALACHTVTARKAS